MSTVAFQVRNSFAVKCPPERTRDVRTDFVRAQRSPLATGLKAEQRLVAGGALHQFTDDMEDRLIVDADCPALPFLGDVIEGDAVPCERDVSLLYGGGAIVMIQLGVPFTADAEEPQVDQPHSGGGHPITIKMRADSSPSQWPFAGPEARAQTRPCA